MENKNQEIHDAQTIVEGVGSLKLKHTEEAHNSIQIHKRLINGEMK